MWMVYYFFGSIVGGMMSLEVLGKLASLFFKAKSRITSKPPSL